MNCPLCSFAISRMGCQWLDGMLWRGDLAVALLWLKEVICHSARRRSPNPLRPPSGCRHTALLALPPRRGVTDLPHHSSANAAWKSVLLLQHCSKNSIPWIPVVFLRACLKPSVQVRKTECSQLHVNPATIHPPALTFWGRFEYLWAKHSSLSPPRMCFWAQKALSKAKPQLCYLILWLQVFVINVF